ncbi:hypothetical protein BJM06_a00097 (plasmid) [Enterobacter cloacae]|nr:hypothetical protein BJM06_a00097 [Enterobacter cloacae]
MSFLGFCVLFFVLVVFLYNAYEKNKKQRISNSLLLQTFIPTGSMVIWQCTISAGTTDVRIYFKRTITKDTDKFYCDHINDTIINNTT